MAWHVIDDLILVYVKLYLKRCSLNLSQPKNLLLLLVLCMIINEYLISAIIGTLFLSTNNNDTNDNDIIKLNRVISRVKQDF